MSDLRNRLIKLAHENPELRKDILPLLKAGGTNKVAHDSLIEPLLGRRDVAQCIKKIAKEDEQSSRLFRKAYIKLSKELDLSDNQRNALHKMQFLVRNCDTMDPALIRNQVFKAADSLGMRLPSGMFASQKMAAGMKLSNMRCFIDPRGKSLVIDFRADTGASGTHSEHLNAGCKEFQMEILKTAKKIGLNLGRSKGCEIEIYQNQFTLKHTAYFNYSDAVDAAARNNPKRRNNQEEMGTLDDLVQALTALGWACTVR